MNTYKPVIVNWIDAHSSEYWNDVALSPVEVMQCVSIGFLVKETSGAIMLARSLSQDELQAEGYLTIPKVCITAMFDVRRRSKKGMPVE